MGWGRTLFLGDIGNRLDIADAEHDISKVRTALRANAALDANQAEQIRQLQAENDDLKLYLASLIRVLLARGVVEKADLVHFVDLIEPDER